MQKLIYVVDDEADICQLVCAELERYGHLAQAYGTGAQAHLALKQKQPDLLIVDLGLPDMDGLNLVRQLQDACEMGVIILSGRNSMTDRVLGLELGADDYISKPFDPRELVARANSILRRINKLASAWQQQHTPKRASFGAWQFDTATLTLVNETGNAESLSSSEAQLLLQLLKSPKQILSREQLMKDKEEAFDRCIDVRMSRIRKKLEDDPAAPRLIKTVYGAGYMLTADVQWH
ncbi:response regulator transcription factor [Thiolinea disciformis]|uniref:response regulator transcription factor n=1 Tax=Thiolinea disciformis TaxID=125614 RepID=UPI00035E4CA8|nr:response regulator transcription factor [Thiolinea disciformis]